MFRYLGNVVLLTIFSVVGDLEDVDDECRWFQRYFLLLLHLSGQCPENGKVITDYRFPVET